MQKRRKSKFVKKILLDYDDVTDKKKQKLVASYNVLMKV